MIPFKSKYIFSLLLFITNNNRYFTYSKKKTVYILDIVMTYIYLWQNWLFIKEDLIIHMLKSLTIFHQILKILLAVFKRFHRILHFFYYTLFLHFGGILYQMMYVADDSTLFQFQYLFQMLSKFYSFLYAQLYCYV